MSVTAWRRWGTELMWAPIRRVRRRGDRNPHWLLSFTALFSRSDSPTSAHAAAVRSCRRDTHSAGARPQAARTEEARSVGVNRSRRSGARRSEPACGARARLPTRADACQTAGSTLRRRPAPTCAFPPARRARGRATGPSAVHFSPSTRTLPCSSICAACLTLATRRAPSRRARPTSRCRPDRRGSASLGRRCVVLEHPVELGLGGVAGARAVVQVDDGAGEQALGRVRVQGARARRSIGGVDLLGRPRGRVPEVHRQHVVGDRHQLAELLGRRLARRRRSCRATSTSSWCRRGRRAAAS